METEKRMTQNSFQQISKTGEEKKRLNANQKQGSISAELETIQKVTWGRK